MPAVPEEYGMPSVLLVMPLVIPVVACVGELYSPLVLLALHDWAMRADSAAPPASPAPAPARDMGLWLLLLSWDVTVLLLFL
jgi:hypothetical protein